MKMDELTKILLEIEKLRSKLISFTNKSGDFMSEGVLELSQRLDELINRYYRLVMNKQKSGTKIA